MMSQEEKTEKKEKTKWYNFFDKEEALFELNGRCGQAAFFAIIWFWGFMQGITLKLNIPILFQFLSLASLVSITFAAQRRCRDLHYKGSFFILLSSVAACLAGWMHYDKAYFPESGLENSIPFFYVIAITTFLSDLFLILVPGKKDQTFTQTSVLLQYPYLYFAILFAVYLGGFHLLFGKII